VSFRIRGGGGRINAGSSEVAMMFRRVAGDADGWAAIIHAPSVK